MKIISKLIELYRVYIKRNLIMIKTMKQPKQKICIVRLDTDNQEDIENFRKLWDKLKVDVVFVPKSAKFIIKGAR